MESYNEFQEFEIDECCKQFKQQNNQKLMQQERVLQRHENYERDRAYFNNYASVKINKDYKSNLMEKSDNMRPKVESAQLCDLAMSLEEKYGHY